MREFPLEKRSKAEQEKRNASPKAIHGRDPSLRWPHLFDILTAKGHSPEAAARISNAWLRHRKKGRLWAKVRKARIEIENPDNPTIWFTNWDEKSCDRCGRLHGKPRRIDGYFYLNGEPLVTGPPAHPNCRCTTRQTNIIGKILKRRGR